MLMAKRRIIRGGQALTKIDRFNNLTANSTSSSVSIGELFTYDQQVCIAGVEDTAWTGLGNLNGSTNGRVFIIRTRGARSNVLIEKIKLHVKTIGSSSTWKFVVFEADGAGNYNRVFSENITVTTGAQEKVISGTHILRPGQLVGIYVPPSGTWGSIGYGSSNTSINEEGDALTGTFLLSPSSNAGTLKVFGKEPTLVDTGDSVMAGSNGTQKWYPFFDYTHGTPDYIPGELAAEVNQQCYQLNLLDNSITYQNLSLGAQTFDWVDAEAMDEVALVKPKILRIGAGTNDIDNGVTWASVESSLDSIKTKLPSGTLLFINEILPRDDFNDTKAATIRTFNANLQTWCDANSAYLILCHDAMAKIRISTGELDDYADGYGNPDGVHLTLLGVQKMAQITWSELYRRLV